MEKIADTTRSAVIKAGLRSVASLVPGGGVFAQAWNEYESHNKNKRIDEFFQTFGELLHELRADLTKIDRDTKEQIPTLIERTVEKVQREASENKRRIFARALLSNITADPERSYDEKLTILETLDSLTESDLAVLKCVASNNIIAAGQIVASDQRNDARAMGSTVMSLRKLEARGLVCEADPIESSINLRVRSQWIFREGERTYQLLPFGRMLLDSLVESKPAPGNAGRMT